mmetsp:Transcript_4774/g.8183  ORF Transcript_4774/g.8183 Transcript_4774/m.8183 type:complete len:135 (+) Transcript_4774:591-995(+)
MTSTITGSQNNAMTNRPIQMNLVGEQIVDGLVWVAQSHNQVVEPPLSAQEMKIQCLKMIVVGRNPFDLLISLANYQLTLTHTAEVKNDIAIEHPEYWDNHIRTHVPQIFEFFKFIFEYQRNRKLPIYFVRIEDL